MKLHHFFLLSATPLLLPLGAMLVTNPSTQAQVPSEGQVIAQQNEQRPQRPPQGNESQGRPPKGDRTPPELRHADELGLTEAQRQQIQALHEQAKSQGEALREQMEQAREQMRSLSADGTSEQLQQQHQTLQQLHQQMSNQRFQTMLAIREILTPEQREQLSQLKPTGRGPGGGRGPGRQGTGGGRGPGGPENNQ